MAREIERVGIPTVQLCNLSLVASATGSNRVMPSVSIIHPVGNPRLARAEEVELRRRIVAKALVALQTEIHQQTIFPSPA